MSNSNKSNDQQMENFNLLVVDDEKEMCESIELLLNDSFKNLNLSFAYNGQDALELIKKQKFLLVITDLNMPMMNGIRMIENISSLPREQHPNHILVLSGYLEETEYQGLIKKVNYMSKPFPPNHLINFIQRMFDKYNKQKDELNGQTSAMSDEEKILIDGLEKMLTSKIS
ncbi:MAG: response regulator [Oligoflexia bacterium]|nr:response regulator [Oligoflexia bacterium]